MTSRDFAPDPDPDASQPSTEDLLQALARDVELMLSLLPAASSDSLVENPHRELDPLETQALAAMAHVLDPDRDNRHLRTEYAEFIQLAVTVDEGARAAQDRARMVLEVLPEDDGVALVRQPFQVLSGGQVTAIETLGDDTLMRPNAEGQQLAEDVAVFLDQNVTIAQDEEGE